MLRPFITCWLTLALAFGPGLCCCSARADAVQPGADPVRETSTQPADCCCGHESIPGPPADHGPAEDGGGDCGCRHERPVAHKTAPPLPLPLQASCAARCEIPAAAALLPIMVSLARFSNLAELARPAVYPSGKSLLRALHVLRC